MYTSDTVLIALHYQNENCHPNGKIKVGIGNESSWRHERLENAKKLFSLLREYQIQIIHVQLVVRADMSTVIQNNFIFKQWVELGAWQENTWGVEFFDGLAPNREEIVVRHSRNNGFFGSCLEEVLFKIKPKNLLCSGVSTAYAVESTVRHASDIGYEVTVVSDACSTATQKQHLAALHAMSLLASIKTVKEIQAELKK